MTRRLLVIDDNVDWRLLVCIALDGSPIEVVGEVATPIAGVAAAARLQPDLILLDIVDAHADALAAVKPIQQAAPGAVIVAVASYAEHQLWGQSPHLGTMAYLSKATPPSELAARLLHIADAAARRTDDIEATASERFPADLRSARSARQFVIGVLDDWRCSDLVDSAALLVSELVTNAVVHAHSEVELSVHRRPHRIRVEVIDEAREQVRRRDAKEDEQSGRGMALIEALAVAWGIDSVLAGKSVWFEMDRPAADS